MDSPRPKQCLNISLNYDAIVVGAGPAGLSAASGLAEAELGVLLLEAESFGGPILNVEWIHDYPRPGEKIAGALLASELVNRAQRAGVEMTLGQAVEIEAYSGCIAVACADGAAHTSSAVIAAAGLRPKKLGVPGEERYQGKGMIHCALCDAGLYRDRVVVVCGGGDAGLIEARYLARFASKVVVVEAQAQLSAKQALKQSALADAKLEIRCGERPVEVLGNGGVTGLVIEKAASGRRETLEAHGVLVHVGYEPATDCLQGVTALDASGRVVVNERLEAQVPGLLAAGDLRSGSPRTVAAAIADGAAAARRVRQLLRA